MKKMRNKSSIKITASQEHDMKYPHIKIKDVTISVFGESGFWAVEILHKPTGISVRERKFGSSIHQNRVLAMTKLNDLLAENRKKEY